MYSKGPWEIKPEEVDKPYIRIRGTRLGGRFKIANVLLPIYENFPQRELDEVRHNALLIAAAPELLEALIEISEMQKLNYGDGMTTHIKLIEMVRKADLAIAKALGEL